MGDNMPVGESGFLYEFEWDPAKAQSNFTKHGVDFQRAAGIFLDPFAITIPDEDHSETEERWITLGKDTGGRYVLAVHIARRQKRKSAPMRKDDETRIRFQ